MAQYHHPALSQQVSVNLNVFSPVLLRFLHVLSMLAALMGLYTATAAASSALLSSSSRHTPLSSHWGSLVISLKQEARARQHFIESHGFP